MKIFTLYWSWHEEANQWMFYHFDKTPDQFDVDCKNLLIKYGKEFIEQETSWVGASDWIAYIADKLPELGYIPIKSDHSFGHFGSFIIRKEEHTYNTGEKVIDEEDCEWEKIVGTELINMAIEKNKAIEENQRKKFKEMKDGKQ